MPQATGLAAELRAAFPDLDLDIDLVRGANGVFDVEADGKLVFSKDREGRFPEYQEIPTRLLR